MFVPPRPKIYHITQMDNLDSIIGDDHLWSDAEVRNREIEGTTIGMDKIKKRRMTKLTLNNYPGLVCW